MDWENATPMTNEEVGELARNMTFGSELKRHTQYSLVKWAMDIQQQLAEATQRAAALVEAVIMTLEDVRVSDYEDEYFIDQAHIDDLKQAVQQARVSMQQGNG